MAFAHTPSPLDRYTEIGELSGKVRIAIRRIIVPLAVIMALESLYLVHADQVGAGPFALMSVSTCVALIVWCQHAVGLPLLPMMIVQGFIIYGLPIVAGHEAILNYPESFVVQAGVEVLVFNLSMAVVWRMAMQAMRPSPPVSYALQEFNRAGVRGWTKLGFGLIIAATGFEVLQGLGLMDAIMATLPSGSNSIVYALISVTSACGFFLISMIVGGSEVSLLAKGVFWILLIANAAMSASDFLLAGSAANLITVAIGFFWSNGKVPWRYLTVTMLCLSFLNTGKTTMRVRYWENADSAGTQVSLLQLPSVFAEWIGVSYDAILENRSGSSSNPNSIDSGTRHQTLVDRVDNLQNLLFVIDAVKTENIKPLGGATYTLILPLLMPRVLWPNKPRTHEGQVLLNVHFGRQDLDSTFTTYIAWGLLPEAYGNFGPITGSLCLGGFMGLAFAWIEKFSVRKLVVSLEGFLALNLLMNLMNSFEMVASVLVTSTFQSMVVIVAASMPFVHRTVAKRRPHEEN